MKALIYGRQSSGEDDYSESVDIQLMKCRALAKKEGIEVIAEYSDLNISGKTYPTGAEAVASMDYAFKEWVKEVSSKKTYREGLGNVLKRLNEVDYIIVYDITRLYRPVTGSFLESYMHQVLVEHHIKVLTLNGVIDFENFNDALIMALQNRINNEQIRSQIEKAKAAFKKLKDEGTYYPGLCRMTGYRPTGRPHEVVIEKREAQMVKDIFKLFNDHAMTITNINRHLNEEYADVFKRVVSRHVITRILLNPVYAGYMLNSEGELIKAKQVEGKELISLDDWMKAKKKLENRKNTFSREKKRWLPLSPFIYCGYCGSKMISYGSSSKERKRFYICTRRQRTGNEKCGSTMTASNDRKEGLGLTEIVKPLLLAEAIKQMNTAKDDGEERKRLAELEIRQNEMKKKTKKLTDMWMKSLMTEEVYEEAMKELKMRSAEIDKEKTKIEADLNRDASQFEWTKLLMKFKGDGLSHGEYEQLANSMIKKILAYKDFITVKTTYGDVDIPRQKIGRFTLCLNYTLQMHRRRTEIYFYYGKAKVHPASSLKDAKKIAKLGEVDIFIVED